LTADASHLGPLLAIGVATGLATLAGGWTALRLGSGAGLLTGFGGGAVIGVALLDLLPEALRQGSVRDQPLTLTALVAAGFMAYAVIDRLSDALSQPSRRWVRHLGPASLVLHSVMDGLGVGIAFNISSAAGLVVAAAVLAHDLLDGANCISLSKASTLGPASTRRWLALDAAAPLAGIGLSRFVPASPASLAAWLAVFAGLFLYIGATSLLPRSRSLAGAAAAVLGAAAIYLVVRLSG